MNPYSSKTQLGHRGTVVDFLSWVLWILWQCVRLPLLLLLTILEPVVSFALGLLALVPCRFRTMHFSAYLVDSASLSVEHSVDRVI